MKRNVTIFIMSVLLVVCKLYAQNTECLTIPLNYDSVRFTKALPVSFGDSMITFNMTNNHPSQGFAYPLAKLVPLTPLPTGMTVTNNNNPWSVFASSWNAGMTMPVYYYYNITAPIPVNYTVTFQLWISNLSPVIPDSCYFDSTFIINLNPTPTSVNSIADENEWSITANTPQHLLHIRWKNTLQKPVTISLLSNAWNKIFEEQAGEGTVEKTIYTGRLAKGIYFLTIEGENINKVVRKVIL